MRLTAEQQRIIEEEVRATFGPDAEVRLFGSRLDDQAKGGDIDLHIETRGTPRELLDRELQLQVRLLRRLGERRIDIVVHGRDHPRRSIDDHALRTGQRL